MGGLLAGGLRQGLSPLAIRVLRDGVSEGRAAADFTLQVGPRGDEDCGQGVQVSG